MTELLQPIPNTGWNQLLKEKLKDKGDTLVQLCININNIPMFVPLNHYQFCAPFDSSYCSPEGCHFTAWGEKYVYFPVFHGGAEWIEAVSRNPELQATEHFGSY